MRQMLRLVLFFLGTLTIPLESVSAVLVSFSGTSGSRDVTITFGGSGSWTSSETSISSAFFGTENIANFSHGSLNELGNEQVRDFNIDGDSAAPGNPFNAALNGSFIDGQYVAFDSAIQISANNSPASFSIIGLVLDDDNDSSVGADDVEFITNQETTVSWPSGTVFSYAINSSTQFELDASIGATYDQAFNAGSYRLDLGVVGTLEIAPVPEPRQFSIAMGILIIGATAFRKFGHQFL